MAKPSPAPPETAGDAPILTILGVEGHTLIAKALKEHFQRPVEAMVVSARGWELARRLQPDTLQRVHALPELHERLWPELSRRSDTDVIRESRAIEARLGLPSVNPHHYFDRHLRRTPDWATAIRRHLIHLRFVEELLVGREYFFIRGENVSQVGSFIQQVGLGLGHRFLRPMNARITGRLEFDGLRRGELLGWLPAFSALRRGDAPARLEAAQREAAGWLETFRAAPKRPAWADANARLRFDPRKQLRKYAALALGRATRALTEASAARSHDRQAHFTGVPGADFLQHVLLPDVRSAVHRRRALFRADPSLEGDFVYFPLHYTPEVSTLAYGYRYEDQLCLCRTLAAYLPTGYRLLVKEHTSMLGRRPYGFYEQLAAMYNVAFVPPRVSTFDLIRACRAVATITGTAGFEAFVLGKPVLAFGDVFYRKFPNVLDLEVGPDMGEHIRCYLADFAPDEAAIRHSISAYFASTPEATMVDLGEDTDRAAGERQAANFARACELALALIENERTEQARA